MLREYLFHFLNVYIEGKRLNANKNVQTFNRTILEEWKLNSNHRIKFVKPTKNRYLTGQEVAKDNWSKQIDSD